MAKQGSSGDVTELIEQAEPNIDNIQQTTMRLIEASKTVTRAKIEDNELYRKHVEALVRKQTEDGKTQVNNTRSLNAMKLNALKNYHAEQSKLMQQSLAQEKAESEFMSREQKKEWAANEKYRITNKFAADREALLQEIAMAGTAVKTREKLELQLKERIHKFECDMIKQELKERKEAADEEYAKSLEDINKQREARKGIYSGNSGMSAEALGQVKGAKSSAENDLIGKLKQLSGAINVKDSLKAKAELSKAEADAAKKRLEAKQEEYKLAQEANARGELSDEDLAQILKEGQELQIEATNKANQANIDAMKSAVADAISGAYKEQYDKATSILSDYMGSIDARLQGSGEFFYKISDKISNKLAISPFIKTTKVLEEMKKAVDNGIAYNIEQRAFLAGISDKIATTFDAFDSNLMRIIRLQQADTTATRMGMEAYLTKMLNKMFQDSSYLSSAMDAVTGALVDATSLLNYKASAEFEYIVQKWLGALSSLGLSDNAVTEIARGLNYLATGDVQNLANNTSLQTMFALAASEANLEYSELLLNGLNADNTNKLLEHVVKYLKKIAEDSENQVVRQAYGDIFNLTASDMMAIKNITASEIQTLANNKLSYSSMETETDMQLLQVILRTSLGSMLDNVYENVLYGVASDMANNPVTFAMQKMLDFMTETNTDIAIPFINVYGFGLDINATVKDLMQMGLGIGQAMSFAANVLAGLASGGSLNLDGWGAKETTRRGSGGLALSTGGTLGSASSSLGSYSASGNSEDMKKDSVSGAAEDSEETKKDMGQEDPEYTMETFFKNLVEGEGSEGKVKAKLVIDPEAVYKVKEQGDYMSILNNIKTAIVGVGSSVTSIHEGLSETVYSETAKTISTVAPSTESTETVHSLKLVDAAGNEGTLKVTLPSQMEVGLKSDSTTEIVKKMKEMIFNEGDANHSLFNFARLINESSIPVMTKAGVELATSPSGGGAGATPPYNQ